MSQKQTICCDTCGDEVHTPYPSMNITIQGDTPFYHGIVEFCSMACLAKYIREQMPDFPELPADPQAKLAEAAQRA